VAGFCSLDMKKVNFFRHILTFFTFLNGRKDIFQLVHVQIKKGTVSIIHRGNICWFLLIKYEKHNFFTHFLFFTFLNGLNDTFSQLVYVNMKKGTICLIHRGNILSGFCSLNMKMCSLVSQNQTFFPFLNGLNAPKGTGVQHKARGPNSARHIIVCGPPDVLKDTRSPFLKEILRKISRAFILKVSN